MKININGSDLGVDIVKDNTMQAVHDSDLVELLKSLGVYDGVTSGEYKCLFCHGKITLENIDSIMPCDGEVQFTCDNKDCHLKLLGLK